MKQVKVQRKDSGLVAMKFDGKVKSLVEIIENLGGEHEGDFRIESVVLPWGQELRVGDYS